MLSVLPVQKWCLAQRLFCKYTNKPPALPDLLCFLLHHDDFLGVSPTGNGVQLPVGVGSCRATATPAVVASLRSPLPPLTRQANVRSHQRESVSSP